VPFQTDWGVVSSITKRFRRLLAAGAAVATLGSVGAASIATAPSAGAAGTYCSVHNGGCQLFATPNTGAYYFTTPGRLTTGMLCWLDGQWTNLNYRTNRWFKMTSAAYGIYWAPASEVINQIRTPHC